jgi:hypothetical protein
MLGAWALDNSTNAIGVGPNQGDIGWWSIGEGGQASRPCLYDDSLIFDDNGTYDHYMDGSTWLEPYQGMDPEGCGAPVAPHVGGSFNYTYNDGVLTVHGAGAHLGLAKVTNQGQEGLALGDSIVYLVSFSGDDNDVMTVDAQYPDGYWRYVYTRPVPPPPPPAIYDVTFEVDARNIITKDKGMYIGDGIFGGSDAHQMSDDDGDGIWSVTLALEENTTGNYAFFNGPGDGGDWGTKENLEGQSCADAENYNNRILDPVTESTTISYCFASCDASCTPVTRHDVTFNVNMSQEDIGDNGVYLGGGLFGGSNSIAMSDDDNDMLYSVTVSIPEGTTGNYAFYNNPSNHYDWGTKEYLADQSCADEANNNDRILESVTESTTISYCFGSCETDGSCIAPPPPAAAPMDNAPVPTHLQENVISIFSDTYNDVEGTNFNPNWGQAGHGSVDASFDPGTGDVMLAYTNFNYQGIEYSSQDISSMEYLHVDIWVEGTFDPRVFVISSGDEIPHPITNTEVNTWISVDIPVEGITGDLTSAFQFKFDGGNGNTDAIYVDNLYFWNSPSIPSIASITPNTANPGQSLSVTIVGENTHFEQGSGTTTLAFSFEQGSSNVVNDYTFINDTLFLASITLPENADLGIYDVYIYNEIDDTLTLTEGFEIIDPIIPGHLVSISPSSAELGQTLEVTITGQNTSFSQGNGTSLSFSFEQGSSSIVNSYNFVDDLTLEANITIPLTIDTGVYDISTINEIDGVLSLENSFTITLPPPPPINPILGAWALDNSANALGVGPNQGDIGWWNIGEGGASSRPCLYDDSLVFAADGSYEHYMDGSTWLEPFQGMDPEGCGTPVEPHVGGSFNYTYIDGVLTVHGYGAHVGLAKVTNQGEDGVAIGDSIEYLVSFSGANNDVMTVDAQYPSGYWRYVYTRPVPPPSCPEPTDLAASNITDTSALLTWIAGGDETTWELVYGPEGFEPFDSTSTLVPMLDTNYYNVTGLTDSLSYDFYVKADCGFGIDTITDLSNWAGPFTFSPAGYYHQVTFLVNTANITVGPNGIYAGGGMLGDAEAIPLNDDDNDGIWSATAEIEGIGGGSRNFIFLNSPNSPNDWGAKENLAGLSCADDANFDDRNLPLFYSDTTLNYCFGSCETDGTCPEPPLTVDITFQVDMSQEDSLIGVPYLRGSWNWGASGDMMNDDDGDGVFDITLPFSGVQYEYIFAIDTDSDGQWDAMESNDPSESCTNGNSDYTNRVLSVSENDTVLGVVCLGSCFPCPPTGVLNNPQSVINLYPNPANDMVMISSNELINTLEIRDIVGRVVFSSIINDKSLFYNTSELSNNIYFVRCLINDKLVIKKFTVNH